MSSITRHECRVHYLFICVVRDKFTHTQGAPLKGGSFQVIVLKPDAYNKLKASANAKPPQVLFENIYIYIYIYIHVGIYTNTFEKFLNTLRNFSNNTCGGSGGRHTTS